ncbi:precorrin-6y C5,15-methyltransferase (decarboxylating) subunit CbiE [Pseudoflavonifractor sp. MSJ-37]|uniref:precorrin-6y C5,15-methyltransferase (decarboxylating) subunit CbiE n=1 Tax=Pseudoflavonifractor sp. MSJ-37 TaxID=2841531 RepID=UPI001C11A51D|nr:precorrin-6y C5,15-methyltransferase (decarboxylating) subunit CbiE [Pseudoflavonifractor sp. MSJ-37]MBU5434724.1 precorrin-6y C5,15-methyltransferase (decarboxylating) subunit CbiE [Pseudoflavonifractor sp. MSJ-37]
MKVYLIGVGMGGLDTLTMEAMRAIEESQILVGAPRLLEPWSDTKRTAALIRPAEIAAAIGREAEGPVAVLLSGDTGFYSGAKGLRPLLGEHEVRTIPGISSLSYFCAKIGTAWQDVFLVSAHGRAHNAVGEIQSHRRTFLLTGGQTSAADICVQLCERGMKDVELWVGERLSYPEERIVHGTAEALAGEAFSDLAVLLAENPAPVERPMTVPGYPDGEFQRGQVPMTKEEIRSLVLSKLRPARDSVIWDVGAGTGSVSVECALSAPAGVVYAVERDPEALELIGANAAALGAANVVPVHGTAPEALEGLAAPDRVFIGGSGGALEPILQLARSRTPSVRIAVTAVTLETLQEAVTAFGRLGFRDVDIVQASITRTRSAGRYHMMDAQNPVWIISGTGMETAP